MSDKTVLTTDDKTPGSQLIVREQIGKSIFEIIGNDEHGYAVVMGTHRLTDWMEIENLREYIKTETLDLTARIVSTMIQVYEEMNEAKIKTK